MQKSIKWVVVGAIGISVITLDLYWQSSQLIMTYSHQDSNILLGWQAMFHHPIRLHILADVLFLGAFGGLYIVPLYVILQEHSELKRRSRTIAGNNIVNALFMVISAIATMLLLDNGIRVEQIFALIGLLNMFVFAFLYFRFSRDVRKVL